MEYKYTCKNNTIVSFSIENYQPRKFQNESEKEGVLFKSV